MLRVKQVAQKETKKRANKLGGGKHGETRLIARAATGMPPVSCSFPYYEISTAMTDWSN